MMLDDLPVGWRIVSIGDVCRVLPGFAFKSADWSTEGVPVIKIKNIQPDCTVDTAAVDHVPSDIVSPKLRKFLLSRGDVLIAMTGATAGKVGRLQAEGNFLLNQRVAKFEPLSIEPDFLWSVVSSQDYQQAFFRLADGAAQPNMSGSQIEGVRIPLPPPNIQRRIAAILRAYDDLIEVNRRRVALLENTTRCMFNEWFVRFHFPGHEAAPMVETLEGPLPAGWQTVPLESVANINARSLSPTSAPKRIGYIDIASVSPGQVDDVTWMAFVEAPSRARRYVCDGSILWSCVRPNRRSFAFLINPEEAVVASTGFAVIDAVSVPSSYLYTYVTTDAFVAYLVGRATGAAYPAVTASVFTRAPVIVPPNELLKAFDALAAPILRMAASLRSANKCLAASRDLLLPRLISGQLSVAAAERKLLDAA